MNWNDKTAANVRAIKPSGIRKFFDIAAQVEGVLSLSIGEPDFAAPDKVIDAMKASLDAKETSYTGNSGMMELRETISETFEKRYGVKYDPKDEILVTVGVSEGLAMALLAMTEPGDEVLIPDPAYVAYPAAVELAGGKAVFVPTYPEDDFKLSVAALEKVVTPKTKALVIGYPNNPTGTVMTAEELMPIALNSLRNTTSSSWPTKFTANSCTAMLNSRPLLNYRTCVNGPSYSTVSPKPMP